MSADYHLLGASAEKSGDSKGAFASLFESSSKAANAGGDSKESKGAFSSWFESGSKAASRDPEAGKFGEQTAAERDAAYWAGLSRVAATQPSSRSPTPPPATSARTQAASTARTQATVLILGSVVGFLLGGVGGALLWPAHRLLGFFLAGAFLGSPVGYGVGAAIAANVKE